MIFVSLKKGWVIFINKRLISFFTIKDFCYIGLTSLLIIVNVWVDLKIPECIARITAVLNSKNATVSDIISWKISTPGFQMLIFSLLSFLLSILVIYSSVHISTNYTRLLRLEMFDKVLHFSTFDMNQFDFTSLVNRTLQDTAQLQSLMTSGLLVIIKGPTLTYLGIKRISTSHHLWIQATIIIILILLVLLAIILILSFPKQKKIQLLVDQLSHKIRETLSGIRTIRAYNTDGQELAQFDHLNNTYTNLNIYLSKIMSLMSPLMAFVSSLFTLVIYWLGAIIIEKIPIDTNFVLDENNNKKLQIFSDMIVFSSYAVQVITGLLLVISILALIPQVIITANRIKEILLQSSSITFSEKENDNIKIQDTLIEFDSVYFTFPHQSQPALKNLNFEIKTGQTIAIAGETGSGKTTLLRLISRYYQPSSGHIKINNQDIKTFSRRDLYQLIAMVPQESKLFSGTIRENLTLGDGVVKSDQKLWEALEKAEAHEFIKKDSKGLSAKVSPNGKNFSGGQRQRLAIARAFAKNAEILIFDDAFSALDYETEAKLRQTLSKQTHLTKIIVTQRPAILQTADYILILKKGRIVETGTPQSLQNTPLYQEILQS